MKRKLALTFAVLGVMTAAVPAQAAPPSLKDKVGDIIVCVMAPCP